MLALVGSGAERRAGERYVVVRHLGRGGMGDVRLVRDAVRGQDVALKRVLEPRPAARIRFKREFRVVADLHHPHLVRLHDLGEDEEGLFFTMEAIDGVDLAAWCTEAPSTAASAVRTRAASAAETQAADTVRSDVGEAPTLDAASADPDPAPRARAPLARVDRVLATTLSSSTRSRSSTRAASSIAT